MLSEDDKQYLALLRLLNPSKADATFAEIYKRKKEKEAKVLLATLEYCKRKAKRESTKGPLETILYPSNNKLGNVPVFKRYVAYLISEHGCVKASQLLNISRTTLWRYFYGLDSSGRSDRV